MSGKPTARFRILRFLAGAAAFALAAIFALLAVLYIEHARPLALPALTGHFRVARTSYVWTNTALNDSLSPTPHTKRQVIAWIWYPTAASSETPKADYLPPDWRAAELQTYGPVMTKFLTRDSAKVKTNSYAAGPISSEQPAFPVVIMRAGGGALTTDFTSLAEDLASHGYIVAGFDAPYRSSLVVLPGGRIITRPAAYNPEDLGPTDQQRLAEKLLPMWTADTQFVIEQLTQLNTTGPFKNHLDLSSLGMFGHSFGGATALQFCHDDSRCKAGIDVDGEPFGNVIKEGLKQPFFFLLSDHGDLTQPEPRQVIADIQSIYNRLPEGRLALMIRGANHFSFSDQILVKSHILTGVMLLLTRGIDRDRGIAVTRDLIHTFFDVHLKHAPAKLLDDIRGRYSELQTLMQ